MASLKQKDQFTFEGINAVPVILMCTQQTVKERTKMKSLHVVHPEAGDSCSVGLVTLLKI